MSTGKLVHQLNIRISDAHRAWLETAAQAHGTTGAALVRQAIRDAACAAGDASAVADRAAHGSA